MEDRYDYGANISVAPIHKEQQPPSTLADLIPLMERTLATLGGVNWRDLETQTGTILQRAEKAADIALILKRTAQQRIEERLALIGRMNLDEVEGCMVQAIEEISRLLARKNDVLSEYRTAQAALEDVKAGLILNGSIDGKNAEQRTAQLTEALRGCPHVGEVEHARNRMDQLDAELEVSRMRYSAAKAKLSAAAAALGVLSS